MLIARDCLSWNPKVMILASGRSTGRRSFNQKIVLELPGGMGSSIKDGSLAASLVPPGFSMQDHDS